MLKVTTGRTPGATSGGTLITTRNHATGAVETAGVAFPQFSAVGVWQAFELSWSITNHETSQAVVLPATADVLWSLTGTDAGTATLDIGVIGNAAVRAYVKATAIRAAANVAQTVSNVAYGHGVETALAPVFASGPAVTSITATGGTFTFTATDPNTGGTVAGAKYQIVARGAALGAWASASAAVSPQTFADLTAESDYDLVVQLTDDTGLTTVSSRYQFQTATAAAVAPSFTSQPALKAASQTSQGFTVTYAVANPGGFTLTHKLSLDGGANFATIVVGTVGEAGKRYFNTATQLWEYTVTGLASGTKSVKAQVLGDVYTVDSTTVSIATGTLALVGSLVGTPSSTQIVWDWPDATGGADGFDFESGTTTGYGTAVSPDPTTSATTTTGLTNGVLIYARVRAHDSAGNVTAYLTASATPVVTVVVEINASVFSATQSQYTTASAKLLAYWQSAYDGTSPAVVTEIATTVVAGHSRWLSDVYTIQRPTLGFDTSAIPDTATITKVEMALCNSAAPDGAGQQAKVVTTTNSGTPAASWFAPANFGETALGTFPANGGGTVNAYTAWVELTGATVSKTGVTYLGLRSIEDVRATKDDDYNRVRYHGNVADKYPKLRVTYTE